MILELYIQVKQGMLPPAPKRDITQSSLQRAAALVGQRVVIMVWLC